VGDLGRSLMVSQQFRGQARNELDTRLDEIATKICSIADERFETDTNTKYLLNIHYSKELLTILINKGAKYIKSICTYFDSVRSLYYGNYETKERKNDRLQKLSLDPASDEKFLGRVKDFFKNLSKALEDAEPQKILEFCKAIILNMKPIDKIVNIYFRPNMDLILQKIIPLLTKRCNPPMLTYPCSATFLSHETCKKLIEKCQEIFEEWNKPSIHCILERFYQYMTRRQMINLLNTMDYYQGMTREDAREKVYQVLPNKEVIYKMRNGFRIHANLIQRLLCQEIEYFDGNKYVEFISGNIHSHPYSYDQEIYLFKYDQEIHLFKYKDYEKHKMIYAEGTNNDMLNIAIQNFKKSLIGRNGTLSKLIRHLDDVNVRMMFGSQYLIKCIVAHKDSINIDDATKKILRKKTEGMTNPALEAIFQSKSQEFGESR